MINLPLYLINRALFRLKEFFRHWYINSFYIYGHFILTQLEKIDRVLAFKITLRYIFQPLYGDRTILGYILGFIFRSGRIIVGGIIYAILIALAVVVFILWLTAPVFIVYKIIS
ncbi:MAG: hypothetical protein AAB651_00380 [Patescibacteria group bacterium]